MGVTGAGGISRQPSLDSPRYGVEDFYNVVYNVVKI
jgi:hypothetical protein